MAGGSTGTHTTTIDFILETDAARLWRAMRDTEQPGQIERCHGNRGQCIGSSGESLSADALTEQERSGALPTGTAYALTEGALGYFSCENWLTYTFLNAFHLIKSSGSGSASPRFSFVRRISPEGSHGAGVSAGSSVLDPGATSSVMTFFMPLPAITYLVQENTGVVTEDIGLEAFAPGGGRGDEGAQVTVEGRTGITILFDETLSAKGMMQIKMSLTFSSADQRIIQELQRLLTLLQNYQWLNREPFDGIPFTFTQFNINGIDERSLLVVNPSLPSLGQRSLLESGSEEETTALIPAPESDSRFTIEIKVDFDTQELAKTFPGDGTMKKQKQQDQTRTQIKLLGDSTIFSLLEPQLCSQGWTSLGVGLMLGEISPVKARVGNADMTLAGNKMGEFVVSKESSYFYIRNTGLTVSTEAQKTSGSVDVFAKPDGLEGEFENLGKLDSANSTLVVPEALQGQGTWITRFTFTPAYGVSVQQVQDLFSSQKENMEVMLKNFVGASSRVEARVRVFPQATSNVGVQLPLFGQEPRPLVSPLPADPHAKARRMALGVLVVVVVLAAFVAVSAATAGAGTLPMLWGTLKLMSTLIGALSGSAVATTAIGGGAAGGYVFHKRQEKKQGYQKLPSDDKAGAASGTV